MPIIRKEGSRSVVEATRNRLLNVFSNGLPVYLGFSGGKDSLCLGHVTLTMLQEGLLDPKLLIVQFIDEEAIYPCVEQIAHQWRKKFILAGATFEWWAIPVKHYNCFNELESDESFICFDPAKQDVWVRTPPEFAIRSHPLLVAGKDTYQEFMAKYNVNGISVLGTRTAESVQRLQYFAASMAAGKKTSGGNKVHPIYDWHDTDVWKYLYDHKVDIPDAYLYLYALGLNRRQLRLSQFFSIDTAHALVRLNEFYPELMDRVVRREPNAYIAALYWDSEMFRRRSTKRRELEKDDEPKDYKTLVLTMLRDIPAHFDTPHKQEVAQRYLADLVKMPNVTDSIYRKMYEALMAGDPKQRTRRAIVVDGYSDYYQGAQRDRRKGLL